MSTCFVFSQFVDSENLSVDKNSLVRLRLKADLQPGSVNVAVPYLLKIPT